LIDDHTSFLNVPSIFTCISIASLDKHLIFSQSSAWLPFYTSYDIYTTDIAWVDTIMGAALLSTFALILSPPWRGHREVAFASRQMIDLFPAFRIAAVPIAWHRTGTGLSWQDGRPSSPFILLFFVFYHQLICKLRFDTMMPPGSLYKTPAYDEIS